jgi:hypothetical protein
LISGPTAVLCLKLQRERDAVLDHDDVGHAGDDSEAGVNASELALVAAAVPAVECEHAGRAAGSDVSEDREEARPTRRRVEVERSRSP